MGFSYKEKLKKRGSEKKRDRQTHRNKIRDEERNLVRALGHKRFYTPNSKS